MDDDQRRRIRWFDQRKTLHSTLGGGQVADIMLWKKKKVSAAILGGLTIVWLLIQVAEYHFLTLLSYAFLLSMLVIFISSRMASLINWKPLNVEEIKLSASACTSFFAKVNWVILNFYEISTGKDLRLFFMADFCLWILSMIGTYVSALNLFYIVVLCLESLPALYERHQMEIDNVAVKVNREMRKLYMKFEDKVLEKIPRGPFKERKLY